MSPNPTDASPPQAPHLARLLRKLRGRLRFLVWMHGLGTIVAALLAWTAFTFLLDWTLHVPLGIRLVHVVVLIALPSWLAWRELIQPLRRLPDAAGLAVLLERERGEHDELLVSATQLGERFARGERPSGDPELARLVIAEAERRAASLSTAGVLDPRTPRLRLLTALFALTLLGAGAWYEPEYASIFLRRLAGGSVAWPQRTHLEVEIPVVGELAQVDASPERIAVRVARGSDVPVLVRARGVVPSEVVLRFEDGQDAILSSAGAGVFRTVLRSCQEDVAFYAVGGDDRDGLPRVEIEVLQPPDVLAVALAVTPPAYTGLPERVIESGEAQVVAGSRVRVHVLTDPPDASGLARLLPEDRELELVPAPFPATAASAQASSRASEPSAAGEEPGEDAAGAPRQGLAFELVAERSLRYRFELHDDSGLSNPDPGLFSLTVAVDRPPTLQVIQPARTDFETVVGGSLALRVLAEDDFGLDSLAWSSRPVGLGDPDGPFDPDAAGEQDAEDAEDAGGDALPGGELALIPLADDATADPGRPLRRAIGGARLTVAALAPAGEVVDEGRQYLLDVRARDNRAEGAGDGTGRAAPIRIRIVSVDALLRRVQDRLSRARLDATKLAELQREKRARVEDLLDGMKSDSPLEGGDALAIQSALTGQRRVLGDARSLSRELASVASSVLYAGLDEKAGAMLEQLDRAQSRVVDRNFHPDIWRQLAVDHAAGKLGSPGLAGRIVQILDVSLAVSEEHAEAATLELDRAHNQVNAADVMSALLAAADEQTRTLDEIERLLERLSEWDNFQSVLLLTRDIVTRQKALRDRTKQLAGSK